MYGIVQVSLITVVSTGGSVQVYMIPPNISAGCLCDLFTRNKINYHSLRKAHKVLSQVFPEAN